MEEIKLVKGYNEVSLSRYNKDCPFDLAMMISGNMEFPENATLVNNILGRLSELKCLNRFGKEVHQALRCMLGYIDLTKNCPKERVEFQRRYMDWKEKNGGLDDFHKDVKVKMDLVFPEVKNDTGKKQGNESA